MFEPSMAVMQKRQNISAEFIYLLIYLFAYLFAYLFISAEL